MALVVERQRLQKRVDTLLASREDLLSELAEVREELAEAQAKSLPLAPRVALAASRDDPMSEDLREVIRAQQDEIAGHHARAIGEADEIRRVRTELLELEKMHHARLLQDYQRQTSGRQMEAVPQPAAVRDAAAPPAGVANREQADDDTEVAAQDSEATLTRPASPRPSVEAPPDGDQVMVPLVWY
jgi:hypothetical protein